MTTDTCMNMNIRNYFFGRIIRLLSLLMYLIIVLIWHYRHHENTWIMICAIVLSCAVGGYLWSAGTDLMNRAKKEMIEAQKRP
jgi:ABC-type bacteriocin/lantibiotic exporter with double-glycine peptidase domain